jgi:hypothetical protein
MLFRLSVLSFARGVQIIPGKDEIQDVYLVVRVDVCLPIVTGGGGFVQPVSYEDEVQDVYTAVHVGICRDRPRDRIVDDGAFYLVVEDGHLIRQLVVQAR